MNKCTLFATFIKYSLSFLVNIHRNNWFWPSSPLLGVRRVCRHLAAALASGFCLPLSHASCHLHSPCEEIIRYDPEKLTLVSERCHLCTVLTVEWGFCKASQSRWTDIDNQKGYFHHLLCCYLTGNSLQCSVFIKLYFDEKLELLLTLAL